MFIRFIAILEFLSSFLYSMDRPQAHCARPRRSLEEHYSMYLPQPITEWASYIYDNAYPEANYNFGLNPQFPEIQKSCAQATKQVADLENWSKDKRKIYDWIYTLDLTENTLLRKPFLQWTVEDLRYVAQALTRLHSGKKNRPRPPHLRTFEKLWLLEKSDDFSKSRLLAIAEQGGPLNEQEMKLCLKFAYFSPSPDDINLRTQLILALYVAQEMLKKAQKISDIPQKRLEIIDCAAFFHFEILRLQAFSHGNSRLARYCAHIIMAQNCIRPLSFDSKVAYKNAFYDQLRDTTPVNKPGYCPTTQHFLDLLKQVQDFMEYFRRNSITEKELITDFKEEISLMLAQDALIKWAIQQKPPTKVPPTNGNKQPSQGMSNLSFCAFCGKNDSVTTLLYCGRCNRKAYCSKDCQIAHWPAHRRRCRASCSKSTS